MLTLIAIALVPAYADAGLPCGCNRAAPPRDPQDYGACVDHEEGDACPLDEDSTGVCDADGYCVEAGSAASMGGAGVVLAAALLLAARRRG